MHGRKRVGVPPPTPEALAATAKKVEQYKRLSAVVLHHRAARTCTAQSLELASQLLAANPDVYTLWNYVREQVLALAGGSSSGCRGEGASSSSSTSSSSTSSGGAAAEAAAPPPPVAALGDAEFAALVAAQLALTVAAIKRNPKSYPAWHHRRWLVERFRGGRGAGPEGAGAPPPALIALDGELALCAELLAKDERNFHCWNYRRWVAGLGGGAGEAGEAPGAAAPAEARELAFTDEKIGLNFSNYSAWHARACLLQRQREASQDPRLVAAAAAAGACCARAGSGLLCTLLLPPAPPAPHRQLLSTRDPAPRTLPLAPSPAELALARKAVFTEPDDQSAWFYRRWVVDCLAALLDGGAGAGAGAPGGAEAAAAAEAALVEDLGALRELSQAEPACKWPLEARAYALLQLRRRGRAQGTGLEDEQALFVQLQALDPRHAAYYRHAARQH
jgi:geranylgeranyl transferase type-2 subunit alpha